MITSGGVKYRTGNGKSNSNDCWFEQFTSHPLLEKSDGWGTRALWGEQKQIPPLRCGMTNKLLKTLGVAVLVPLPGGGDDGVQIGEVGVPA